jgi:hypothetical protein
MKFQSTAHAGIVAVATLFVTTSVPWARGLGLEPVALDGKALATR